MKDYDEKNNYEQKCHVLIKKISLWKNTHLFPYKANYLALYQQITKDLIHKKKQLTIQKKCLIIILEETINSYNAHLSSQNLKNQPDRLNRVWQIFDTIAIRNKNTDKWILSPDLLDATISIEVYLKIINLIFQRAKKKTYYHQHPITRLLLESLDTYKKKALLRVDKKSFRQHTVHFTTNYENKRRALEKNLYEAEQVLAQNKDVQRRFNEKMVFFQTQYHDIEHHYTFEQKQAVQALERTYEKLSNDNEFLLRRYNSPPFYMKKIGLTLFNDPIHPFDSRCASYYLKITELINHCYDKSAQNAQKSLSPIGALPFKQNKHRLWPLVEFIQQHQKKLETLCENVAEKKALQIRCQHHAIGLVLLKEKMQEQKSMFSHAKTFNQASQLINYLTHFLTLPIEKQSKSEIEFMHFYHSMIPPNSHHTIDSISSLVGF